MTDTTDRIKLNMGVMTVELVKHHKPVLGFQYLRQAVKFDIIVMNDQDTIDNEERVFTVGSEAMFYIADLYYRLQPPEGNKPR